MPRPFEVGKTYKDTDGRNVTIVDTDYNGKLLGVLQYDNDRKVVITYRQDGNSLLRFTTGNLVQEKTKIEGWARIWERDGEYFFGRILFSKNEAQNVFDAGAHGKLAGVVKIEWEG